MLVGWCAGDYSALCSHANRGAIACFCARRWFSVNLHQLREINFSAKSIFDGDQISVMTICRELCAMSQTLLQIVHEMIGRVCMATANKPARDKLCFRVQGDPCPHVTPTSRLCLRSCILLFRSDKSPNLIALKFSAVEITESFVLIF